MPNLDELAAQAIPARMNEVRINANAFIEQWQAGACELLDVRVPAETRAWKMGFGLAIPADQIADRLDELPRDKRIVVACPLTDRSSIVRVFLAAKGFDAVYLSGGLLGLADALKGNASASLSLEPDA